jgi:hypothetical protein
MIRAKRLRAMRRLLDYAVAESQDLQLANLEHLLGAATLAIDDAITDIGPGPSAGDEPQIKLVVNAGSDTPTATRLKPAAGHPANAR